MPALFDIGGAKGLEAVALFQLADRLSECEAFIELSESVSAAEARTKITIGPIPDPLDGEQYKLEELKNDHFWCRIAPPYEESHETERPDTITECPLEGGRFEIYLRRQAREAEIADQGKSDVYLYFLDRCGAIAHQVKEKAQTPVAVGVPGDTPRLGRVYRERGPAFGDIASSESQGEYIWADYVAEWGDLDLRANS